MYIWFIFAGSESVSSEWRRDGWQEKELNVKKLYLKGKIASCIEKPNRQGTLLRCVECIRKNIFIFILFSAIFFPLLNFEFEWRKRWSDEDLMYTLTNTKAFPLFIFRFFPPCFLLRFVFLPLMDHRSDFPAPTSPWNHPHHPPHTSLPWTSSSPSPNAEKKSFAIRKKNKKHKNV